MSKYTAYGRNGKRVVRGGQICGGWTIKDHSGRSICACSSSVDRADVDKIELALEIERIPELQEIRAAAAAMLNELMRQGAGGNLVTRLSLALVEYNA